MKNVAVCVIGAGGGVRRHVRVSPRGARTTALTHPNDADPRTLSSPAEFAVTVDGKRHGSGNFELTADEWDPTLQTLTTDWELPGANLRVRLVYRADKAQGVVRKWMEIEGCGKLTAIELETWDAPGARGATGLLEHNQIGMGPMGLGQPVFWNGFFAGIEHPGAENYANPAGLACRLDFIHELTDQPMVTPPCVLGAGQPGDEWPAFMDYIDARRPSREPPFVALINNWYQFGRLRHRSQPDLPGSVVLDEMRAFAQRAQSPTRVLDFYCLDDPWTDFTPEGGIWGHLSTELFPGGLESLKQAAHPMGVGLWVGPIGGYLGRGTLVSFGQQMGYETRLDPTDDSGFDQRKLCCHAPRYHAHLRASLAHWARQGVRYWKFDGVEFTCDDPTHGHPTGLDSRVAQMDSWIDLMQVIRDIAPDSVIAFTTGSNPSPWWLPHVDFVWRGGGDDRTTEQDGPRRERFTTYIDACVHLLRPTSMPLASVVVFGLIQNAAVTYASEHETPEAFERFLWHMVGRGSHHHDVYISPDALSEAAWQSLVRIVTWARARRQVLARMRMILGDPSRGEVYGFASYRAGRGIITLRNPAGVGQSTSATLRELFSLHFATDETQFELNLVYGKAALPASVSEDVPLALTLPPFGVVVMEVVAVRK